MIRWEESKATNPFTHLQRVPTLTAFYVPMHKDFWAYRGVCFGYGVEHVRTNLSVTLWSFSPELGEVGIRAWRRQGHTCLLEDADDRWREQNKHQGAGDITSFCSDFHHLHRQRSRTLISTDIFGATPVLHLVHDVAPVDGDLMMTLINT